MTLYLSVVIFKLKMKINFNELLDICLSIIFAYIAGSTDREMILFGLVFYIYCSMVRLRDKILNKDK